MSKKKNKKTEEESNNNELQVEENKSEAEGNISETEEVNQDSLIAELEDKVQTLQDSLLRKVAEFENYKRRTENDQLNFLKYSAESFILKILPVYDDLSRSVSHLEESNHESIKEGLKLVYGKFTKILDEQGVKKLEVKGKEFDVDYHEALMQQPSDEFPANTVLEEVEAGYLYKDKVIRHAKVIVSQEIPDTIVDEDENKNEE